jgi:DNA-binding NtrC family response regulator
MAQAPCPILLVEDDPSVRAGLAQLLSDHGYSVRAAATLGEGRRFLADPRPAVCLLDLNLPDGNGLELLREVARRNLPLRIVVMTAFSLQHLRPDDAAHVLVDWLAKPVAPDALLRAVGRACDLARGHEGGGA